MESIIYMVFICALMGYLVGCINLSYLISKLKGYDIREHGSGNAGASNVIILMGKKIGFFVALVDILKAYAVVRIAMSLFPDDLLAFFITATAVILGHIFPFYMGFKGGKGLATLGGSVLAYDLKLFVILLIIAAVLVFVSDYICFAPLFASIAFPFYTAYSNRSAIPFIFLLSTLAIIYRHLENLRRIQEGKELKFSFLWNRKREAERFGVIDDDGKTYPFEQNIGPAEHKNMNL
ncbi:MAG: glycerol-3-phosphate 1-O-acyltransferase PlsY [Lachnospiraceae bacterium]|nr:glycerol-3-phosphate 1-O-acyltransferase PlsY [Lachnospiraceae bacterium]